MAQSNFEERIDTYEIESILRVIGDEFKREARRNALRARNENDDIE